MLPKGIKSSGYPAVEATCQRLGLEFDPWQADLTRCILAKDKSGVYAADTVAISIPRQTGKTWDIGALVFALCVINPGLTVVWTAHRFKVARETFMALKAIAQSPLLLAHVDPESITTAAGNECIPFRNGSRIVFAARERGSVRGFSKVGVLVLDEGQILTENALSDLVPTTNQAENPLIVVMGTPPRPIDPGEVFKRLRSEALAGESDGVLYVEFSAERGADPDSREAWRQANPSYPKRTSAKAIHRLRKLLSTEDFVREALGIWDEDSDVVDPKIDPDAWARLGDPTAQLTDRLAIGVEVSPDRRWVTVGVVGGSEDRVLAFCKPVRGISEGIAQVVKTTAKHGIDTVALDPSGQAGSLIPDLEDAGLTVVKATARQMAQACGHFLNLIDEGRLVHLAQPEMAVAARLAETKDSGDAERWARKEHGADVSPIIAATVALHGYLEAEGPSAYEARGLMTL